MAERQNRLVVEKRKIFLLKKSENVAAGSNNSATNRNFFCTTLQQMWASVCIWLQSDWNWKIKSMSIAAASIKQELWKYHWSENEEKSAIQRAEKQKNLHVLTTRRSSQSVSSSTASATSGENRTTSVLQMLSHVTCDATNREWDK